MSFAILHNRLKCSGISALLICRSANGQFGAIVKLDLDKGVMTWVQLPFAIISTKNDFTTARTENGIFNVGGEFWVIHQVTGGYERASVGWLCKDQTMLSCALTTTTDRGICTRE
jgi:hypothetical protein